MHRQGRKVAATALLLSVLAIDRAAADPKDACLQGTRVDEIIEACTREISSQLATGRTRGHDIALIFFRRGTVMLKRDTDRAMRDFGEAIKADPGFAEVYEARGMQFLVRKNDLSHAIADFDQAIRLAPTNVHFLLNRALAHSRDRDYKAALADYDRAIKLQPTAEGYVGRGIVFDNEGDYDRAFADFSEAIRIEPADRAAYFDRAVIYMKKNDIDRAIVEATTAVGFDGESIFNQAPDHMFRGRLYFMSAKYELAAADFETVVSRRSDHTDAILWLYLARARAHDPNAAAALASESKELQDGRADPIWDGFLGVSRWLYPLVPLFLGKSTPEATLATSVDAERRCIVQFFLGEWYLLHDDAIAAAKRFNAAAAAECSRGAPEYFAAQAELARLPR
jgi:tetratricopeptide (TPR) repeat protein